MQPSVQENAPEGACSSIGVVATPQPCHAAADNASQPELIKDDSRKPTRRGPDPRSKPTWEQWLAWDKYRRLLNDSRLVGHDAAFKLWHWYDNCKDKNGEVSGFRAQAWYIARKFGWKPATIYAMHRLLFDCGYLSWRVTQGCQQIYKALGGIRELPERPVQAEMPFVVPVQSGYAPEGTPELAECASKGTAGMPQGQSKCAPTGTPYTMCDLSVKECVRDSLPPGFPETEQEAVKAAARLTCSDEYAAGVWNGAMARGGKDWRGLPIADWPKHLECCWAYEQRDNPQRARRCYMRKTKDDAQQAQPAMKGTDTASADAPGPMPGDPGYESRKKAI